uniref:Putative secreted peptide n=1 Tax=Anopheles braziliensis TaxID=58242 RepID=A0A2M3ZX44_9DIPT
MMGEVRRWKWFFFVLSSPLRVAKAVRMCRDRPLFPQNGFQSSCSLPRHVHHVRNAGPPSYHWRRPPRW